MATVYLLCGLPASGKSTFARTLELTKGAIRLTLDDRMRAMQAYDIFAPRYGKLADAEKLKIWEESKLHLASGKDVILDWSLWNKVVRKEWVARVSEAGYAYKLFYLNASLNALKQRLLERNKTNAEAQHIPLVELERFSTLFEPPSTREDLEFEMVEEGI